MNMKAHTAKLARGFTLVELMIAMLLSLFLLGAITYVVVNSNKNYNTTDSLARLQENARFAMEFITRDLRRAGYIGCAGDIDAVNSTLNGKAYGGGGGLAINGLEGIEDMAAGTSTWLPSKTVATFASGLPPVDGSDAFAARYLDLNNPVGVVQEMPNESAVLFVTPGHDIKEGDVIAVSDCESADVMQVTHVNASGSSASGKDEIGHNAGGSDPGNETQKLSKSYGPGSQVLKFGSFAYYVGTNSNNRRALFRITGSGTQELVEGVEHMQILYGLASGSAGADRSPTTYVKASDVADTDWRNVVSMRVGLLLGTIANTADGQYGVEKDTGTYSLNGTVVDPPDDRRLRKMFVSTIMLRNIR